MLGWGIVKGLGITLRHFVTTYVEDLKYYPQRATQSAMEYRMAPGSKGIYTIQYPEEKPVLPERFRFLPFLVTDYEGDDLQKRHDEARCTSCGICAKVCPAQCIWMVRDTKPDGKPLPRSKEFYIDVDMCMNCGYCAEFCPFDSIIMDHDYALADYERDVAHIHDMDRLLRPASHYKEIRPAQFVQREEERRLAEEEKKRKAAEKAKRLAAKQAAATAKK